MSGDEERFFFVHVQKTAGISLVERMRQHFGEAGVYPDIGDRRDDWVSAMISPDYLLERWRARGDEIKVVSGHFPLCVTELLGGGFTTITILRDPVERTLSWLRNRHRANPPLQHLSLEEIYDDRLRFDGLVHNHMVKMFSLTLEEMTDGVMTTVEFDPDRLERAKERLATVDVLGLQERFDELCNELESRFGWQLGAPVHANRTEPAPVAAALRQRIAADNADDISLYRFAQDLSRQHRPPVEEAERR